MFCQSISRPLTLKVCPNVSQDAAYASQDPSSVQSGRSRSEDNSAHSQPPLSVQSGHSRSEDNDSRDLPKPLYSQRSRSELAPMVLDQEQHESSTTPEELGWNGNDASFHGIQYIYRSSFGKAMETSHEGNTSENYAFQEIGNLSSGRKPTFPLNSVPTKIRGAFRTKKNKANNGAEQRLFAPDDPNTIATYNGNSSDTGAIQYLGMDVGMDLPAHKSKKWVRAWK